MRLGLQIRRIPVGPLATNCYLVVMGESALIVDPGDEGDHICQLLERSGARLKTILYTHGHFDHVGAGGMIRERTGADVYMHRADDLLIEEMGLEGSLPDKDLEGVDVLEWGGAQLRVIHTPGHSPGSVSFLLDDNLFTGDTLFAGSIGRTDLPGGSTQLIMESLSVLASLDSGLHVLPGHGPRSTLHHELNNNPFLRGVG